MKTRYKDEQVPTVVGISQHYSISGGIASNWRLRTWFRSQSCYNQRQSKCSSAVSSAGTPGDLDRPLLGLAKGPPQEPSHWGSRVSVHRLNGEPYLLVVFEGAVKDNFSSCEQLRFPQPYGVHAFWGSGDQSPVFRRRPQSHQQQPFGVLFRTFVQRKICYSGW